MSRVLLVDDSPHAQRMGERILSEEGYEVVTVSNADSALVRLEDVDPDVVLADTVMPVRTGYDICHYIKMSPRLRHVRVILTAGVLEPFDDDQIKRVNADTTLKKPFEASALVAAVKPLADDAAKARSESASSPGAAAAVEKKTAPVAPFIAVVDAEQVRAAVTVALDAAMDSMVDAITKHVLTALQTDKLHAAEGTVQPPAIAAPPPAPHAPVAAPAPIPPAKPPVTTRIEPVRRVNPLRQRSGSILGLEISRPEPGGSDPEPES
jgi:CheY-like chemotaxis protein